MRIYQIVVITVFDVILKKIKLLLKKIEILQYIGKIKVGQYCFGRTKYCNILQYIAIIYCSHKSNAISYWKFQYIAI